MRDVSSIDIRSHAFESIFVATVDGLEGLLVWRSCLEAVI